MRTTHMTFYAQDDHKARRYADAICHREGYAGYGELERVELQDVDMPPHREDKVAFGCTFYAPPH